MALGKGHGWNISPFWGLQFYQYTCKLQGYKGKTQLLVTIDPWHTVF